MAVVKEPIATPARMRVVRRVLDERTAIPYATETAINPPVKDAIGNMLIPP